MKDTIQEASGFYCNTSEDFFKQPLQGLSRTLKANQHDSCVIEPLLNKVGEVQNSSQAGAVYNTEGISPTLCAGPHGYAMGNILEEPTYRIRKLTPKECIRLMNFDDSDYDKIKAIGMSDSQIYKQCGNSIVVACLVGIFRKMFIDTKVDNEQLSFF